MKKSAAQAAVDNLKTTSQNSACCIIPPYELWESIQGIRAEHDKSYPKWPVHINILWPFIPAQQFSEASERIKSSPAYVEKRLRPFRVRLARFEYNKGSKYLFLVPEIVSVDSPAAEPSAAKKKPAPKKDAPKPTTPMDLLVATIHSSLPLIAKANSDDEGHKQPHLTVGQFDQAEIERYKNEFQSSWTPIEFDVTEISFISRESSTDNFNVRMTIPLEN